MGEQESKHILRELQSIRQRLNALLFMFCILIVWVAGLTFVALGADIDIASKDRHRFPVTDWPYLYYFGTGHLAEDRQLETAQMLAFAICSCNRNVVIEHQLPVVVAPTVYRIDTRTLGWEHSLPNAIKQHYPYSLAAGTLSLLVRADWFVQIALDQEQASGVYFGLLFGKAPNTLDQFLKLLEVTPGTAYQHGHIEAASGVSVQGTRLITTTPTAGRSDVWITYDSAEIAGATDPLEHLDRTQKFDASEIIGSIPKTISATGAMGNLQVYALANGQGQLQNKAPSNIVVDYHGTRGVEIRNPMSCMICHEEGLRPLKQNALRQFIESGAEAFSDYKNQQEIERFHLTSLQNLITRHNEDYAIILEAINGLTPQQNAVTLHRMLSDYDAPLNLERAARELDTTARELQLALGFVGHLPARVAQLAHGQAINRDSFEIHYRQMKAAVDIWRKQK